MLTCIGTVIPMLCVGYFYLRTESRQSFFCPHPQREEIVMRTLQAG
jgi:hypothetical protein